MKFSYTLIKKLVPGLKSKKQLIEALTMHAFETENKPGNTFEVAVVPPNRYSDAASHWGIAREAAASLKVKFPNLKFQTNLKHQVLKTRKSSFKVSVKDKKLCPRYIAWYFKNVKVKPSPKWMQQVLKDCGLRPINNVVDIMNYAMLEVGQPLHAFDADKIKDNHIIIRPAKKGESITSIDGEHYKLSPETLVIADGTPVTGGPLAIAGIKGGKSSEVTAKTKNIIVESANFDPISIYKSSKFLKLTTDASLRFSHGIHPKLAAIGINRVAELLKDIVSARAGEYFDSLIKPSPQHILKFDIDEFNHLIGAGLDIKTAAVYLKRLGFTIRRSSTTKNQKTFLVEIPPLRSDIETHEDLAEEVARMLGYNKLKPQAPHVSIHPAESEDIIFFKDKVKKLLTGFGLDEVYNHSFISERDAKKFVFNNEIIELENPISEEFQHLRPSLIPNILKNIDHNSKFFDEVKIFEIGRVFIKAKRQMSELDILGIALASKNGETFFELKDLIDQLLKALGLVDFVMVEPQKNNWIEDFTKKYVERNTLLEIKSGDNTGFAYLGKTQNKLKEWDMSVFEADVGQILRLVREEKEYEPLSKYPSVMRDVSLLVNASVRIGDLIQEIQRINVHLIRDVDLIDEYRDARWDNKQSITLRIIFQADNRTLTNREVENEMKLIIGMLQSKFKARVR